MTIIFCCEEREETTLVFTLFLSACQKDAAAFLLAQAARLRYSLAVE
jgi:hypothetical protein